MSLGGVQLKIINNRAAKSAQQHNTAHIGRSCSTLYAKQMVIHGRISVNIIL